MSGIKVSGLDEAIDQVNRARLLGFDRGVRASATAIERVAREQWASGTDPYGNLWPPRKVDGAKALGALPSRAKFSVSPPTLSILFEEDYAVYHQLGSPQTHLPQRRLVPDDGAEPSEAWVRAADDAFQEVLDGF